jgi:membrane protein DedA with SNARE-associated domain
MRPAARTTLAIIVALLIPIIPFAVIGELPGERWLSAADGDALAFAATGTALLASDVLLPVPSSVVGTLLGARLGFLPGFLSAWLGMTVGALAGYGVGHLWPARLAARMAETPSQLLLFVSRPVPVLAEAMALTAGAARVRLAPFLLATAAGNAVYAAALTGNGAALLPEALVGPGLLVPMLAPVVAWLTWRWLARRATRPSES